MGWPQIALIALFSTGLLLHARDHGKPKTGRDNFWIALFAVGIQVWLLWSGGFFSGACV